MNNSIKQTLHSHLTEEKFTYKQHVIYINIFSNLVSIVSLCALCTQYVCSLLRVTKTFGTRKSKI
jgi:hypothetical protein